MKTKLTLSIDKDLVQFARVSAVRDGRSVSGMFSDYLIAKRSKAERTQVTKVADMVGSLKTYVVDDSKAALRALYAKKHQ